MEGRSAKPTDELSSASEPTVLFHQSCPIFRGSPFNCVDANKVAACDGQAMTSCLASEEQKEIKGFV